MRSPKRKRPLLRQKTQPPKGVNLNAIARRANYVGSVEHKTVVSPAGLPQPRSDSSKCKESISYSFKYPKIWLRRGIEKRQIGEPWEGDFPRYVWYRARDNIVYEGRLVNRDQGEYKGWPLEPHEYPDWI